MGCGHEDRNCEMGVRKWAVGMKVRCRDGEHRMGLTWPCMAMQHAKVGRNGFSGIEKKWVYGVI